MLRLLALLALLQAVEAGITLEFGTKKKPPPQKAKAVEKKEEEKEDSSADDTNEESGEDATEENDYLQFWEAFGKNIKLGLIEDSSNRTKLSKLLRFKSSFDNGEKWHSLEEYVARMKENQANISFLLSNQFFSNHASRISV